MDIVVYKIAIKILVLAFCTFMILSYIIEINHEMIITFFKSQNYLIFPFLQHLAKPWV